MHQHVNLNPLAPAALHSVPRLFHVEVSFFKNRGTGPVVGSGCFKYPASCSAPMPLRPARQLETPRRLRVPRCDCRDHDLQLRDRWPSPFARLTNNSNDLELSSESSIQRTLKCRGLASKRLTFASIIDRVHAI